MLDVLVAAARRGEKWAVIELLLRVYGRPVDRVELASEDGADQPRRVVLLDLRMATAEPVSDNGS